MQPSRQNGSWRSDLRSFGYDSGDRQIGLSKQIESSESQQSDDDPELEYCVPLFISDENGEPDPSEYILPPLQSRRASSISSRILAGVCVAAVGTILYTSLSSDSAQNFFKASFADLIPAPLAATPSGSPPAMAPLKAALVQMPAPERKPTVRNVTTADLGSAPGEIARPDQLRGPVPAAVEAPKPPAVVVHHLDPGEIATAIARADALIASGDIAAARLVLQRAADSEDARAAIKLAGTYDPEILTRLGVHGIVPDPAKAREWYEKAKTFGAPEAAMRLDALATKHR